MLDLGAAFGVPPMMTGPGPPGKLRVPLIDTARLMP